MVSVPLMNAIRQAVSEFSENTSIHGVRYIAENGRRWIERVVWIVTEVVCIGSAMYMLMYLLVKYQANPTMTRVDSYFNEVADVPFPAITLCNVNRIFRSKALRVVESLKMPEGYPLSRAEVMRMLPLLGQLLSFSELGSDIAGRTRLERVLKYNNISEHALIEELGQPCMEMIERCSWEGREVNCSKIFTKTMTYLGFCCSFNSDRDFSLPPIRRGAGSDSPPLKTTFFGYPLGLTVLLNPRVDDYYWSPFASGGVVCIVHDSGEMATERSPQAMVAVNKESMVQMLPNLRVGSASLRNVRPERRRCLFEDEGPESSLRYSDTYSFEECTTECEAATIWRACGCRPLNYPRLFGSRGTYCTLSKLACLSRFQEEERETMLKSQVRGSNVPVEPAEAELVSESKFEACGCLAQCNSVDYDLETTTADFGASRWVRRHFYADMNSTDRSLLHVYFDSQTAAKFINDLVSSTVQLMSSFGGIFSLFLGCSFMSAVELLYFLTVRVWLLIRGHGRDALAPPGGISPSYKSPASTDLAPSGGHISSFGHRPFRDDSWGRGGWGQQGWGTDKPVKPRVF